MHILKADCFILSAQVFARNHYGRNKTGQDYLVLPVEKRVLNVLIFLIFHNINFKKKLKVQRKNKIAVA